MDGNKEKGELEAELKPDKGDKPHWVFLDKTVSIVRNVPIQHPSGE